MRHFTLSRGSKTLSGQVDIGKEFFFCEIVPHTLFIGIHLHMKALLPISCRSFYLYFVGFSFDALYGFAVVAFCLLQPLESPTPSRAVLRTMPLSERLRILMPSYRIDLVSYFARTQPTHFFQTVLYQ